MKHECENMNEESQVVLIEGGWWLVFSMLDYTKKAKGTTPILFCPYCGNRPTETNKEVQNKPKKNNFINRDYNLTESKDWEQRVQPRIGEGQESVAMWGSSSSSLIGWKIQTRYE